MTALDRLYTSGGDEIIYDTLEIDDGQSHWYLVKGYDDLVFSEFQQVDNPDGSGSRAIVERRFRAANIDVALPARNIDGSQDLNFAISNIDGQASSIIRDALEAGRKIHVTYRCYLGSSLADTYPQPAETPTRMVVKQATWTATDVQLTAGYMNLLDTQYPRRRYTLNFAPGLRYIQ